MIMTEAQKASVARMAKQTTGEDPIIVLDYHDSWTVAFKTELAALRLGIKYTRVGVTVKPAPGIEGWVVNIQDGKI